MRSLLDHCYVYEHADQSWRSRPALIAPEAVARAGERIADHATDHGLSDVRIILHGTCRVFVPLYSPRYFKTSIAGKEWFAFSRRALNQATANGGGRVETIVPALWIPIRDGRFREPLDRAATAEP